MNEVNTYPEMNAKIVALLRMSDEYDCMSHYAAKRIEELERENKELKEMLEDYRKESPFG